VSAKVFQQARDLTAGMIRQVPPKGSVLQAADVELTAGNRAQQLFVIRVE
jgi:hypothetical protein